jgi:hypothetical protein
MSDHGYLSPLFIWVITWALIGTQKSRRGFTIERDLELDKRAQAGSRQVLSRFGICTIRGSGCKS